MTSADAKTIVAIGTNKWEIIFHLAFFPLTNDNTFEGLFAHDVARNAEASAQNMLDDQPTSWQDS